MNKTELRASMRARRAALSQQEQREAAQAVYEQLMAFELYQRANVVMAYMACRGELSLEAVIGDALARGKTLLLPRCEAAGVMTARRIRTMDDLAPGAYGLLEPKEECAVAMPQEIDLILVPGVAFDHDGNRLGQGGGYYDRFLGKSGARRVGVCYTFALMEQMTCETHDIAVDDVITPGGMIRTGKGYDRRT